MFWVYIFHHRKSYSGKAKQLIQYSTSAIFILMRVTGFFWHSRAWSYTYKGHGTDFHKLTRCPRCFVYIPHEQLNFPKLVLLLLCLLMVSLLAKIGLPFWSIPLLTRLFIAMSSPGVRVSAFPITGTMLTLSWSCFMNSISKGFNLWINKKESA